MKLAPCGVIAILLTTANADAAVNVCAPLPASSPFPIVVGALSLTGSSGGGTIANAGAPLGGIATITFTRPVERIGMDLGTQRPQSSIVVTIANNDSSIWRSVIVIAGPITKSWPLLIPTAMAKRVEISASDNDVWLLGICEL